MAINPKNLISEIYNLKSQWSTANQNGDETAKNNAATKAQEYYKQLEDSGYADVSNQLKNADLTTAKNILNKYSTAGMTSTRDYLYSLGKNYGMSNADVDNIIAWNNDTGEISIGGKSIGRPDLAENGKSYWNNSRVLDNAFNDYVTRSGIANTNANLSSKNSGGVNTKVEQLWGIQTDDHNNTQNLWEKEYKDIKKTNPFTTDEAKAILAKYDLSGLQARDNAAASGGASNGGNIDSYAASNALRQQAALVNQGQMVVLDSHQQKLDNARAILEGLGAYQKDSHLGMQNTIGLQQTEAQRLYGNDETTKTREFNERETAKNNEIARMAEQARVSGYTPSEWVIKNDDVYNRFLNGDGSFKKEMENVDIQALINSAKARGNTEEANKLAVVRGRKILGNYGAFGQYSNAGDISFMSPERTAEYDLTDKQIKSAEKIAEASNETQLSLADKQYAARMEELRLQADAALKQIQAEAAAGDYAAGELNGFLSTWKTSDSGPRNFLVNVLWKDYINKGVKLAPEDIKSLIEKYTEEYNIDVADARLICNYFDVSDSWLDSEGWTDRTSADDVVKDGVVVTKGEHRGMKKKES